MKSILYMVCIVGINTLLVAGWGARNVDNSHRPDTLWLERFSQIPDVNAVDSISDAITQCDAIVGSQGYCTIGVPGQILSASVKIKRSRTKLVGIDENALRASQEGSMFYIGSGIHHIVLENLNLEGTNVGDGEIDAIRIEGRKLHHIAILHNEIHDFATSNGDAHAIGIYGMGKGNKKSIRNILIQSNTIYNMQTGSSETIAINGNVRGWEVSQNDIYDINNIAIDAIGGEGTAPTRRTRSGRILPGKLDVARYGYILDNYIENMHTYDNPAYNNQESWAAAIYIDGAHHILVRDNVVVNSAWAYEIGAENCMIAHDIVMYGNDAQDSYYGDLLIGGHNTKGYLAHRSISCNPRKTDDSDEGHGYVRYITVYDNTLETETPQESTILLQYRTTHAIIEQVGVAPINEEGNGSAQGDDNAVRTSR